MIYAEKKVASCGELRSLLPVLNCKCTILITKLRNLNVTRAHLEQQSYSTLKHGYDRPPAARQATSRSLVPADAPSCLCLYCFG